MATTNYDEGLRRMSKLVNSLLTRADCGPFREPVDWRELGLFDYPKIIKKVRFSFMLSDVLMFRLIFKLGVCRWALSILPLILGGV
jgi:hypothetical protein